jgi:hypothetical protein
VKSLPLHRHRDDDYCDRIDITALNARLVARVVPRYKTSDLSGDEWRVSAVLELYGRNDRFPEPVFSRSFHRMKDLLHYAPRFVYMTEHRPILNSSAALLHVQRKGVTLFDQHFLTFGDAAIGLAWHIVVANEGSDPSVKWHHLTDEEERARCQQVGCSEPPVNTYHLKTLHVGYGVMRAPEYNFTGQYTWYCARHSERGDCGLEDADKNLDLVEGDGVARPHAGDESESAFGGIIGVGSAK